MTYVLILLALAALHESGPELHIVSGAGLDIETFFEAQVPKGAVGVLPGGLRGRTAPWSDLLEAGGWDVAGLRWDDPLELASDRVISTNREGSERRIALRQVGERRLAFLSVTMPPPGRDVPGLTDPEAAVRQALADIEDGGPIVLLVAGTREQAANILRKVPRIALAVVAGAGSGDPAPLRIGDAWLVEAPWGGAQWGMTSLRFANGRISGVEHRFEIPRDRSEAVAQARRKHGLPVAPLESLVRTTPDTVEEPETAQVFANRACRFSVYGMRTVEQYGTLRAPAEGRLIVLDMALENIIPMTLVEELQVPTEYRAQNLADHLYLVVNGNRLARIVPNAERSPGHVPVRGFRLPRLGDRVRGNVVFGLGSEEVRSLELRFYDFAHGHAQLALMPAPEGWEPGSPVLPPEINEIVEAGVYDMQIVDELDGRRPPEGMAFLSVELRARSMFSFEADATAFDPQAQAGQKTQVGTVADWLEAHKYAHAVVDNEFGYAPEADLTTLGTDPRFLPDMMTGGRLVFLVPERFRSLALRGDFPNARLPNGEVIRPGPIRLTLRGEPPELPERQPTWQVDDETIEVTITGQSASEAFAGADAGKGRLFLVLDVTVRNFGDKPEFFQTVRQLQYVDGRGRQSPPHQATFQGVFRPTENIWVPNGEQRTFQVAYLIDRAEHQPRLSYRGFSLAEIVNLPPLSAPVQVAATPARVEEPIEDLAVEVHPPDVETEEVAVEVELIDDPDAPPLTGVAQMRVIAADEMGQWVREHNREAVNLALGALGAHLSTDAEVPAGRLLEWYNGRIDMSARRLTAGTYRLRLAGPRKTKIHQVVLAADSWSASLRLTIEAADGQGGYTLIARLQGIEERQPHLRVLEFDPVETDEIRLTVACRRARGWLPMSFYEVMVYEGPLADKSQSVLSRGGTNISRLDYGGSVFHTNVDFPHHLLTSPQEGRHRRRWSSWDRSWTGSMTLAFQANRAALIEAVELWPPLVEEEGASLPDRIRLSASPDEPFEGYTLLGEYEVPADASPWRVEFPEFVRARFLRVELKPRDEDEYDIVSIGELVVREGTEPGYQSVLVRGDGVGWRHREQPTLASLMGEDYPGLRVLEDETLMSSMVNVAMNEWVGSTLERPEQRHAYRVTVDYDPSTEIPELLLHMAPFVKGRVRILDTTGQVMELSEPQRRGGTTLRYPLSVEPGDYLVEISSAPVYLFMGFDTSGSMGQALPITRASLPGLLADLPEGIHIALGSSLYDRETQKHMTLFSPYSRDPESLRQANESMFDARMGGSDWYNFLRDMLEWADENTPPDAVGAKVLVADGVGSGDYPTMWDRLHRTEQRLYTVGWGSRTLRLDHVDSRIGWTAARGLFNAAWYCNGRYFEPQADQELVETYREILRDVQTPARYALRVQARPRRPGRLATVAPAGENRPIHFVLDASGSMLIELEGRTRLAVAFDVMEHVVNTLPDDARVGLRVYGHRYRYFGAERDKAATDTELLIPIGPLDRAAFIRTVRGINARGATPLVHTIEQVPGDLRRVERPLVIILTDGVESFRRDPVAATRGLRERHPDMELAVVGFMIEEATDQENLRGMAEAGGGIYYNALNSRSLIESLEQALNPVIRYTVRDRRGRAAATGKFGDSHELLEGDYELHATMEGGRATLPIWIRPERTVQLSIDDLPEPKPVETVHLEEAEEPEPVEPAAPARFCTQCGQRLTPEARFCTGCGARIQ